MFRINHLIDENKCYQAIRQIRWPYGVHCPHCTSNKINKRGKSHRQPGCCRYTCKKCGKQFDIEVGTIVNTDEYGIYNALPAWGYVHQSVCHSRGEYARDEDGDGFHEIHVNTMEGFWSLLRSWLRPHRGISQEKLPIYLGFLSSLIMLDAEVGHC